MIATEKYVDASFIRHLCNKKRRPPYYCNKINFTATKALPNCYNQNMFMQQEEKKVLCVITTETSSIAAKNYVTATNKEKHCVIATNREKHCVVVTNKEKHCVVATNQII